MPSWLDLTNKPRSKSNLDRQVPEPEMPRIFRVMKERDGRPEIGSSASTLGVRVPADLHPDSDGIVQPGIGGMSVSTSLLDLPARLVPLRLRFAVPGAAGSNSLRIWSMGEGDFITAPLTAKLMLRLDPKNHRHGFVEPIEAMTLLDYAEALSQTQDLWVISEPQPI
jgi:hypothetical protein